MNEFKWKGKNTEELTREELIQCVNFFVEGHDQFLTYSKTEDMKKLEIENKLLKELVKK